MASIAANHGFLLDTLWNLPENADLKKNRNDPYVLYPGDKVFIPDLRIKQQDCATEQRHEFVKKGVQEQVRIVLKDEDDAPLANQPYVLEIDKLTFKGQTDGSGAVQQPIPPNAQTGHLVVGEGDDQREFYISLGNIDPVDKISGVQGRLLNLGYYDGQVNGQLDGQTRTALLLFQEKYDLSPTGENDTDTQNKLKELFGS